MPSQRSKPKQPVLTHRQQLQLATPDPKHKKSRARTLVRRKLMKLAQSIPPIRQQNPPYRRKVFRYGFPEVYQLGAVNGVPLNYGIDSRHAWGESTDLA